MESELVCKCNTVHIINERTPHPFKCFACKRLLLEEEKPVPPNEDTAPPEESKLFKKRKKSRG